MAIKFGTTLRNARADTIETTIGTAPILRIYSGSAPTNPGDAATGDLLVEITLPSDWLTAASNGAKAINGTWQDASANGDGTAGYFRIWNSGDTVCHIQGTCSASGAGGDMELDNTSIAATQEVNVTAFTLTEGNV